MTTRVLLLLTASLFFSLSLRAQTNNSLLLDGCTNFFEIADDDRLDFQNGLTVEAWINPNCDDGNRMIVAKEWCQQEYAYTLSVREQRLLYTFSKNGNCNTPNQFETTDQLITPGTFHHVAVVHSPTDIKLYVDGIERAATYISGSFGLPINSNEPLRIGVYQALDRSFFAYYSGLMDELRVWSAALSAGDINSRMGAPLSGNETNLALYLDMEDTGTGNALTLVNKAIIDNPSHAVPMGAGNGTPYITSPAEYDTFAVPIEAEPLTCISPSATLSLPDIGYKSVMWSTGDTSITTGITSPGAYSVIVETEACRFLTDTIEISLSPSDNSIFIEGETALCSEDELVLNAASRTPGVSGTYTLAFPDMGAAAGAVLRLEGAISGEYVVTFIDDANCDTLTAAVAVIIEACAGDYAIPELITPNGDNVNDEFRLYYNGSVENYTLLIFNRWGQKIFSSDNPDLIWDGSIGGEPQETGSYLYLMRFRLNGELKEEGGSFALVR
ncbi:T9SS type B sorting domain-containing protein [Neolewinella aurantiaca]|uniref:T9SS type B sorting domain-containing protein n=1 Tax=Neolewinella aurantiaca TaxID=2602767 RepID=A0A5C7FJZ4_9BACT|nr:LamG-like jellyroll fold domain-containing protein [Neolewinella aurantiaca]TXF90974.1 T9SS type B sorting domain-containing protein [Neolewinella aurantiaca]